MKQAVIAGAVLLASGCIDLVSGDEEMAPSGRRVAENAAPPAPPPARAPAGEPAPPGVAIEKFMAGGSGCEDPESLTVAIDAEGTAFLVIFDRMTLSYPPGPQLQHVNCVASVKVAAPAGWRFSVADATTRGYAYLSHDQSAKIASKYFFAGSPPGGISMSTIEGPHDGDYRFTNETPTVGWSKCGGQNILHLHTMLILNVVKNKADPAVLSGETADGRLAKSLAWKWERC